MKTLIEHAKTGTITPQVRLVAEKEGVNSATLCRQIADGSTVIMQRGDRLVGIGRGISTKINVNLGTSTGKVNVGDEIRKARIAEEFGADTISDLSMGGDIDAIREEICSVTTLPITTVPVYQAVVENGLKEMTSGDILTTLRKQAETGISSVVVHCVSREMLDGFRKKNGCSAWYPKAVRSPAHLCSLTSARTRSWSILMKSCRYAGSTILSFHSETPHGAGVSMTGETKCRLPRSARILSIAHRALERGVQVIIEGCGGHIRSDRIPSYIKYQKGLSPFPLFVAGPLPTDIAIGFDHIPARAVGVPQVLPGLIISAILLLQNTSAFPHRLR